MKRKALFIGVNEYADQKIQNLRYAVGDAALLFAQFKAIGYDAELLPNPTRSAVEEKVAAMTTGMDGEDDVFLFYFAGHGFVAPGDDERLFCKDDFYEKLQYHGAGISFAMLRDTTGHGGLKRIFILDACRANMFAGHRGTVEPRDLLSISKMMGESEASVRKLHSGGHAIWRSCSPRQCAIELQQLEHGLFSLAIDRVMTDCRNEGQTLTFDRPFMRLVVEKMGVIARAEGIVAAQTPEDQYSGNWPSMVLISGRKAAGEQVLPQQPPPPQYHQPSTAPAFVVCPVCMGNVRIEGTHNCVKCGKKYVCAECWDREHKCCVECAGKMREADKLLEEGKRLKEKKAYSEAAECFRKAADLGNGEACHEYGDMLLYGRGVERDVGVALEFYRKCDDSDGWVQYNIGMCHLHFAKERDVAKEGVEAVAWLKKSAEQGVPWACVKLGECYRDGVGVSQDFSTAASWYPRALEDKGLKTFGDYGAAQWAEFNMGWLCRNGQGVAKDPRVALQWFRRAAARKSDAADPASTAAAEVLPEVLAERVGDKLGKYWQDFRIIHGVQIRDDGGRLVPLAGLVASNRAIFVGVSLESLPANIRNSLPSDNPAESFAQSISNHCGIPLECFLPALVVPETYCVPGAELPSWAVRESNLADAMLKEKAEKVPDWLGKRQDIIRKLETLPMSSEGAEKNALIHFKADEPEWEYGAALLEKVEKPSSQLIQLARRAAGELDQAGKSSVADNVRKWLEKKGR